MVGSLHLDFETFSEVDVTKVGAWAYSRHPSTEVICAYTALNDDAPLGVINENAVDCPRDELFSIDGPAILSSDGIREAIAAYLNDHIVHAFHSFFEWCIWVNVLGGKPIPFERMDDTEARAAAAGLPRSLDQCCIALDLPEEMAKATLEGKALIHKLCKPQKVRGTKDQYYRNRDPELVLDLGRYCGQDTISERAVSRQLAPLKKSEQRLWVIDQEINARGIRIDVKSAKKAIGLINQAIDEADHQVQQITGCEVMGLSKVQQLKDFSAALDFPISSVGKALLPKMIASPKCPEPVRQLLEIRQDVAKTSVAKYKKMLQIADRKTHRIHGMMRFHGAGTGRWSGSLVQIHNIPRGSFKDVEDCIALWGEADAIDELRFQYGSPMEALSTCLRGMIIPSKGKRFFVFDFSQIEARMTAWMAGQEDILDVFRTGEDVYRHTAAKIYKTTVDQIHKDSEERFVGKTATLALGFQGGWRAFVGMAEQYGVEGISEEFARDVVDKWRKSNKDIYNFWYAMNDAAIAAVKSPGSVQWVAGKKIGFQCKGRWLRMRLPSKRKISYFKPAMGTNRFGKECVTYLTRDSQSRKYVRRDGYGGMFTENAVQGAARDVMAGTFDPLIEAGFTPVFSVHDEVITEASPDRDLQEVIDIVERVPDWAPGLPVAADGYDAMRYRK